MDTEHLTAELLCKYFDHTLLKPFATEEDFKKLCQEAAHYHFAMVAINSAPVSCCKSLLKGTDVHVGAAISFPLGQTSIETKVFETKDAIDHGADEIDYVIHIGKLKEGKLDYIQDEMERIVSTCRQYHVISKVIFENCYLTKEEITALAKISRTVLPDYIKTSTGFGPSGAIVEDVERMKQIVGNDVKVKAAGGIRTWESCKMMIHAGADRIGTSSSIKILEEFLSSHQSM